MFRAPLRVPLLSLTIVLAPVVTALSTDYAKPPEAYSIEEHNSMTDPGVHEKIYRDGDRVYKEDVWDKAVNAHANMPHGAHINTFIDLKANKQWSWDPTDAAVPCTVGTGDWGDPFQWFAQIFGDDLAQMHPKDAGTEQVAGRKAKLIEVTGPDGSKMKIWRDDQYGLLLKMGSADSSKVDLEVTKFETSKPPASVFSFPAKCPKS